MFINNDFSKATLELRKDMMTGVKRLRALDKISYLNYITIVSREKVEFFNFLSSLKMQFESNFECLSFNLFSLQENFMNNESDPEVNLGVLTFAGISFRKSKKIVFRGY